MGPRIPSGRRREPLRIVLLAGQQATMTLGLLPPVDGSRGKADRREKTAKQSLNACFVIFSHRPLLKRRDFPPALIMASAAEHRPFATTTLQLARLRFVALSIAACLKNAAIIQP